jgi:hypothetical protein
MFETYQLFSPSGCSVPKVFSLLLMEKYNLHATIRNLSQGGVSYIVIQILQIKDNF